VFFVPFVFKLSFRGLTRRAHKVEEEYSELALHINAEWIIMSLMGSSIGVCRGVTKMEKWVKPDFSEFGLNAECSAYSGTAE
jgi:hypothetical protein